MIPRTVPALLVGAALVSGLAACGENSPATEAEHSPAVSEPVDGVPQRASPEAQGRPETSAEAAAQRGT